MARRVQIALAAFVALVVACGDEPVPQAPPSAGIRTVMYAMESERLLIEQNLRNPGALGRMLKAGRNLLRSVELEAFASYPGQPAMQGKDGALFEQYRQQLLEPTRALVSAAEAGDLDALYEPFTLLDASCTRCHKRFDPTY